MQLNRSWLCINYNVHIHIICVGAIASTPRIQDWHSTKNRRLEGPIPYVLLELLLNEKKFKFIASECTKIHHLVIKN